MAKQNRKDKQQLEGQKRLDREREEREKRENKRRLREMPQFGGDVFDASTQSPQQPGYELNREELVKLQEETGTPGPGVVQVGRDVYLYHRLGAARRRGPQQWSESAQ